MSLSASNFLNNLIKQLTKKGKEGEGDPVKGIMFPGKINLYTSVDLLVANVIKESYEKERVSQITFGGKTFNYVPEKSSTLWAHYEDERNVLVGIHGADDLELNLLALNEALSLGQEEKVFDNFCVKYRELLEESKRVIIGGHSIGGLAIQKCFERHEKKLPSITYAAYTPRLNTGWAQNLTRKWVFRNDWLSSNQLKIDNPVNLHPVTPTSVKSFVNGHGLFGYLDKDNVNRGL